MKRVLTFKRARTYAAVVIGLYALAWGYVVTNGTPPLNASGVPISGDYIAFHAAGRLLLTGRGAELYDHAAVAGMQSDLLGGVVPGFYDAFRNPPFAALPFVPLAWGLDLLSGFAAWSLVSVACLALSLYLVLQVFPSLQARWRGIVLLVLAFPPLYFGLIDGENATVSLLLYVLIFRALCRDIGESWQAGVWAGLGLFKPQLFVIFPVVFAATRNWRALIAFTVTTACLAGVCFALVGVTGMQAWLRILVEPESRNALANAWRMASLKSFFDTLLPGQTTLALSLYLGASAFVIVALFRLWSARRVSLEVGWILTSLGAVLVNPHLVDYDLTVLIPAGILAAVCIPATRWPMVLLYLLVLIRIQLPMVGDAAVQLSPLALILCAALVCKASLWTLQWLGRLLRRSDAQTITIHIA